MDSLRLILLIAGIAFVAAIYLFEKIRRNRADQRYGRWGGAKETDYISRPAQERAAMPANTENFDNDLDDFDDTFVNEAVTEVSQKDTLRDITDELQQLEDIIASRDDDDVHLRIDGLDIVAADGQAGDSAVHVPDEIIAINIFARDGRILSGPDILNVAMQLELNYGDMGFFHCLDDDGDVIFSMANAFKPGSFDIADMEGLATRGLVLFMSLPCKGDPLANFDAMLTVARDMATQLHAQLHDEARGALTRQGIDAIRLRISEYKSKTLRDTESA